MAQAILREGLLIQDRFSAEPVYAKTGKGYLKSVGVSELQELKKQREAVTYKTKNGMCLGLERLSSRFSVLLPQQ